MFNRISCLLLFLAFLGLGSSAIQAENSRETSEREIRFIIFIVNDGLFQIQTMMNKTNIIAWHSFYLHKRAEIDKLKTYVQEKKYDNSLVTLLDEYVDLLGESEILRIDINKIRMS